MIGRVTNWIEEEHSDLKKQAHLDLSDRARGGVVIYLIVWLITAYWGDINQSHPLFFYLNTSLFILLATLRLTHYFVLKLQPSSNTKLMYRSLVFLILASALHWGIMAAWVSHSSNIAVLHYPYMIISAAFAIGGTSVLSISRSIGRFYPILIFVPMLVLSVANGGMDIIILNALAGLSTLYVLASSNFSHKDYWRAITLHQEAKNKAHLMEQQSITDPLTKLHNRLHFNNRFSEEWNRCSRLQHSLSTLMIDLDHFKSVNDTYGHLAGDECLKAVALVLKAEVPRLTDVVARYGGEEFIVLLPNTELSTAEKFAESIVASIGKIRLEWNDEIIPLSCSIGCACNFPQYQNSQELLIAADAALYQAKESGRNQYCVAPEENFFKLTG